MGDPVKNEANAWDAYQALRILERDKPELRANPYFIALVDAAFARFIVAMDVMLKEAN